MKSEGKMCSRGVSDSCKQWREMDKMILQIQDVVAN